MGRTTPRDQANPRRGSVVGRRRVLVAGGLTLSALGVSTLIGAPAANPGQVPPLIGPVEPPDLHLMSYNIRVPIDLPPHSWHQRRPLVRELLRRERPTILGVQEGRYPQMRQVLADLGRRYDWIHLFSGGGSQGDAMAIVFDTHRVEPLGYDHVWLSNRPRLIGSTTWGNRVVRMLTWVHFSDLATGRDFVVLNTHLDHESSDARRKSADLLVDLLADLAERWQPAAAVDSTPIILLGDFNASAGSSQPYRILVGIGGLVDTWDGASTRVTRAYSTANRFDPIARKGRRIDWILTSPHFEVGEVGVNTWSANGRVPSDHWPVQAVVRLATEPYLDAKRS